MKITNNLLAAYAKGNVSEEERLFVRHHLAEDVGDLLSVFDMMDEDKDLYDLVFPAGGDIIDTPGHADNRRALDGLRKLTSEMSEKSKATLFAVAADNTINNLCDIRCEGYVLRKYGIEVSDEQLESDAIEHGWLTDSGTKLMNVGNLCELHNLHVSRQIEANLKDVKESLLKEQTVIVSVDEGELVGDKVLEDYEDRTIGKFPDHVVIITAYDEQGQTITIFDPNTPQFSDLYPVDQFMDAWNDSNNYMITVSRR